MITIKIEMASNGVIKTISDDNYNGANELNEWKRSETHFNNHTLFIKFRGPFSPRRGRINCSLNDNGKWRWFGIQFPIQDD